MRLDRLLSIVICLLNRDLVRAHELADRFGVTVRTIQRDMASLQDAGIPIMTIQGPNGGYGIMSTWRLDRQLVTVDNLFYMLTALNSISETLPDPRLEETLEKVRTMLPGRGEERKLEERKQRLYVDFSMLAGRGQAPELFDTVQTAIDQNRMLQIEYTDSKLESTTRTVEPMTLVFRWRSWYLFGFCRLRDDYRLFRMSRIRNPVLLDRRFVRRNRTIREYLAELDATGRAKGTDMVLRFDRRMASVASEVFGDDAKQNEEDGSVIVHTSMPEDGWLYGFLLSFGAFLEVIEPPHLRGILADAGARIAALYHHPI